MVEMRGFSTFCAVLFAAVWLAGCGADDVQLEGRLFDAVGMSDRTRTKAAEPKMAARPPLVVPPALNQLPDPNAAPPTETASIDGIQDHDAKNQQTEEQKQQAQAEYCKKNYEPAKAMGAAEADAIEGPLGPCRASVLSSFQKWRESQ